MERKWGMETDRRTGENRGDEMRGSETDVPGLHSRAGPSRVPQLIEPSWPERGQDVPVRTERGKTVPRAAPDRASST